MVRLPIGILPHPRPTHAMPFKASRKRVVLDQLSYGVMWIDYRNKPSMVRLPVGILPHPRPTHAMPFKASRKRVVLDQLSSGVLRLIFA
jgi:hypothetical protein